MPSPYIEREAAICRMTKAIKPLSDTDLRLFIRRSGAYAKAQIPVSDAALYDYFALDRETIRRTRLAPVYAARDAMAGLFMLAGFYLVWIATPSGMLT